MTTLGQVLMTELTLSGRGPNGTEVVYRNDMVVFPRGTMLSAVPVAVADRWAAVDAVVEIRDTNLMQASLQQRILLAIADAHQRAVSGPTRLPSANEGLRLRAESVSLSPAGVKWASSMAAADDGSMPLPGDVTNALRELARRGYIIRYGSGSKSDDEPDSVIIGFAGKHRHRRTKFVQLTYAGRRAVAAIREGAR